MSSETHANYSVVGFTLVVGVAAIAAALVYFGGVGGRRSEVFAETYYDAPVTGLSVGSEVNLRGVKVGEVREISFVGAVYDDASRSDMQKVYILMAFNPRHIRTGLWSSPEEFLRQTVERGVRATVSSRGVTGLSRIELNIPRGAVPPPPISWKPAHVCIPPAPSMFESFSDAATKVMNQMNNMDFAKAWSNIATVAESVAHLAVNVEAFVDVQKGRVGQMLENLDDMSSRLRALAEDLRRNPSALLRGTAEEPLPETAR